MKQIITLFLLLVLLAVASLTLAQGNNFTLDWWTVDGGGGMSSNGRYTLLSGYWDGPSQYDVYLPLVIRP